MSLSPDSFARTLKSVAAVEAAISKIEARTAAVETVG
jgi:hypothetical protein